jgi:hypothetical protein
MFKIDPACLFRKYGAVSIDHLAKRVLRTTNCVNRIPDFLKSDTYKQAVARGLLPTAKYIKTENNFDVLEVEYIDFVTRSNELSGTQLVHAARRLCALQQLLLEGGWYVARPHLNNIAFNPKPMMIDLGDIVPLKRIGTGDSQLLSYGAIWHCGYVDIIFDPHGQFKARDKIKNWKDLEQHIKAMAYKDPSDEFNKHKEFVKKGNCLKRIKKRVADIKEFWGQVVPNNGGGKWSDYPPIKLPQNNDFSGLASIQGNKSQKLWNVLREKPTSTLIDFACSTGFYSMMADSLGYNVIGLELCEDAAARAYEVTLHRKQSAKYAVTDFMSMPKPMGKDGCYRSTQKRIRAKAGMVPAVTHHLFKAGKSLEWQADFFSGFVDNWLIIEFIPRTCQHIKSWNLPPKYNEGNFREALGKHWENITTLPSHPDPRIWLLCEGKK